MIDQLISYDQQLFIFLNGMHSSAFDFIMYWLSDKLIWIPLYAWILFRMIKENRSRAWLVILLIALLVTLTDQVSVQLFKNVFHRLRPCHEPAIDGLVRVLNGHCGGKYGFVSSHACNTAGIAIFSGLMLKNRYKWLLPVMLTWSALISYSRIYLGVHYPGDVLGGFMVGGSIGYAVFSLWNFVNHKLNRGSKHPPEMHDLKK
ncbi:MAG: phosphatase PAP2 family protein [Lentimicrobium sp.]